MNAVQWLPLGLSASTSSYSLTGKLISSLAGVSQDITFSKQFTLTSSDVAPAVTNPSLPYSSYAVCNDKFIFTSTGSTVLTFPFGSFVTMAPMRPLCATVQASASKFYFLGDWQISVSVDSLILASGWASLNESRVIPTGFSPITFTGRISKVGQVVSIIGITSSTPNSFITIVTPQVQLNSTVSVTSLGQLAALQLDPTSGSCSFVAVTGWSSSLQITTTVPNAGYYIFGALDNSKNFILPATLGKTIQYIGQWGTKKFSLPSMNVTVTGTNNFDFYLSQGQGTKRVTKVTASTSSTVVCSYIFGYTGTSMNNATIQLNRVRGDGFVWAY